MRRSSAKGDEASLLCQLVNPRLTFLRRAGFSMQRRLEKLGTNNQRIIQYMSFLKLAVFQSH